MRDLRIVAPPALMPDAGEFAGCTREHDIARGIAGCDVVMMLRIQKERFAALLAKIEAILKQIGAAAERDAPPAVAVPAAIRSAAPTMVTNMIPTSAARTFSKTE